MAWLSRTMFLTIAFIAASGCARGNSSPSPLAIVAGYGPMGDRQVRKSNPSPERCNLDHDALFAARCEDAGLKALVAEDCTTLCSGRVDP